MKLTCYALDDEKAAISVLTRYIFDTPALSLAGASTTVAEASKFLSQNQVDILFLDVEMPKLDGMQFLELYAGSAAVILTTAYSQYAVSAYEKGVVDYLLKPIEYSRFLKAIGHLAAKRLLSAPINETQDALSDFLLAKTDHKGKFQRVDLNDIVYVESLKNYVAIVTRHRERIITYIGMTELEGKLPTDRFARVHRSFIVAFWAVVSIDGNEIYLKDAPRVPTAGAYREAFFKRLGNRFIQGKP